MKIMITSLIMIICLLSAVDGARILAIFPFHVKSHYSVYEPLLKRLSTRGHEIVAVTHFPQRIRLTNFTELDVSSTLLNRTNIIPVSHITIWKKIYNVDTFGVKICEPILGNPKMKKLINAKEHLLVIEIFNTDCFLGIAHALNIPKIVDTIATVGLSWLDMSSENLENPSYIPNFFSSYTRRMSLLKRLINTMLLLSVKLFHR